MIPKDDSDEDGLKDSPKDVHKNKYSTTEPAFPVVQYTLFRGITKLQILQ